MHASVAEYRLRDIDERDWAMACIDMAPSFARVPGLVSKLWLKDRSGRFGGVYIWQSESRFLDFTGSDLGVLLTTHPNIDGLTVRDWAVESAPTAITEGDNK